MHDARSIPPAARAAQTSAQASASPAVDILGIEPALARIIAERSGAEQLRALADFLRRLTNARAMVVIADGAGGIVAESWSDPGQERNALLASLPPLLNGSDSLSQASVRSLPGATGLFLLSSPLTRGAGPKGNGSHLACLILAAANLRELEPFLVILQTSAGFFHAALDHEEGSGAGRELALRESAALLQATALIEMGTVAGEAADFSRAGALLTQQLRRHFDCFWVCLGSARTTGGIRLETISGVASFERENASSSAIEAAMREALLQGNIVEFPAPAGNDDTLSQIAHRELLQVLQLGRALTVPLHRADGGPLGALTFLWESAQPLRAGTEGFLEAAAPYLQAQVGMLRRAEPPFWKRWWAESWQRLGPRRKWVLAGAFIAAAFLLCWPLPQHLHLACRVQPLEKRFVTAPFDGILKEALVEPGQSVTAGTPLATLDDKELRWKEADLEAARDQAFTQRNQKMTDGDSAYALSQVDQLEAQQRELDLRVIDYEIAHLDILSPVDGVVLTGDLKRAVGSPVSKGQALFEVAPLGKLVIDLDVPDTDASFIRPGMDFSVRFEAMPGQKWSGTIRKVNPQSEPRNGENVFVAEADLPAVDGNPSALRPGMEGKAVVYGDRHPLGWLLFHRLWNFLRLLLFW